MIRLLIRFALVVAIAGGVAWIADRPGALTVDWLGMRIETSVALAVGLLAVSFLVLLALIGIVRRTWHAPGALTEYFRLRKTRRGYDALSKGIVAVGAGDVASAKLHVAVARKVLGNDPLTKLLEAQAAQMAGQTEEVTALFADMSKTPETKLLGLRGLFNQARHKGDLARARKLAEEALAHRPGLPWASRAMLMFHSSAKNWQGVSTTLEGLRKTQAIDATTANRKQAVVLTAQAAEKEKTAPAEALALAVKAHRLDPSLVPAAAIAARLHANEANTRKASKIIEKTWRLNPHVELGRIHAHSKPSASPRERLKRIQTLVARSAASEEGAVAVAEAAIEAQQWDEAKAALEPYLSNRPRARICALMAEIAEAEGDKGRAREWLTRAVRAPRDPQWTADGIVSDIWLAVSPVSGELGGFEWKAPLERLATEPGPEPNRDVAMPAPVIVVEEPDAGPKAATAAAAAAALQTAAEKPADPLPDFPLPDDPGIERTDVSDPWAARG
jgi:HemY protein